MKTPSAGFFHALGVFAGLSPFDDLRKNSWWRVLWHLFLMTLLCTLFIVVLEQRRSVPYWTGVEHALREAFGSSFLQTPGGFIPEKDPLRSRTVFLPQNGAIQYIAPGQQADLLSDIWKKENFYLMLFGPGEIAGVICSEEKTLLLRHAPGNKTAWHIQEAERTTLPDTLKRRDFGKVVTGAFPSIPLSTLFGTCRAVSFGLAFAATFFSLYLLTILYTGIFIAVFRISSRGRMKVLSLRELWKSSIYASFPAMAVASCFPALELPFFQLSTIFMIGQMGYTLVVLSYFERGALAKQQGDNHEQQG